MFGEALRIFGTIRAQRRGLDYLLYKGLLAGLLNDGVINRFWA